METLTPCLLGQVVSCTEICEVVRFDFFHIETGGELKNSNIVDEAKKCLIIPVDDLSGYTRLDLAVVSTAVVKEETLPY